MTSSSAAARATAYAGSVSSTASQRPVTATPDCRPGRDILSGLIAAAGAVVVLTGCQGAQAPDDPVARAQGVALLRPTVVAEMPHDPTAFTEGLELDGSALYEGTGNFGHSQLRELDPATGAVRRVAPLPPDFFGEGITVDGDRIWQLTWRNNVAIEWDKDTFTPLRQVPMGGEGWGLCRDGERLIRSDGSNRLYFHDRADLHQIGDVEVTRDGTPVRWLNELECVDGQVWANVWQTDEIVRIDPASGAVTAVVDAATLLPQRQPADVMNGIAYAGDDEFLLTGKDWPKTFRVRFVPAQ